MMTKAEIDTSAPFRSVKEAVMLFGDRVLAAGEVSAAAATTDTNNKLHEVQDMNSLSENDSVPSKLSSITAELEETKQSLQKAREESLAMATCLSSLQEELQRTKTELQLLKQQQHYTETEKQKQIVSVESEIEDLKFIEDTTKLELKSEMRLHDDETDTNIVEEFQKKRYVTFANPPAFAHHVMAPLSCDDVLLQRHPSLKKKKKKPLIPLISIGGIFSRNKKAN